MINKACLLAICMATLPLNAHALSLPEELPFHIQQENIAWLWDADLQPQNNRHVASLTEHILLTGSRMLHRFRQSSPVIAPLTASTPLVHVEFDILHPPPSPTIFHDEILHAVLSASKRSTSGWVQLDYEARPSHRLFYKSLVHDIKAALSPNIKLSVTALAWWCHSNDWLDNLDADEVVPMFFRMGRSAQQMNDILARAPERLHVRCRATSPHSAIGFAVQEAPAQDVVQRYAKVYWFNYTRWKEKSAWPPLTK